MINYRVSYLLPFIILLASCSEPQSPEQAETVQAEETSLHPVSSPADSGGLASSDGMASSGDMNIPDGVYAVDKTHTYVTFSYSHLGYSYPLLRVTGIDGELTLDTQAMENSQVSIAIDANTIDTTMPRFDTELKSLQYFNVKNHPHITFTSSSYEPLTENTGKLTGNLSVRGKTNPVVLDVVINNAMMNPFLKKNAIGFSATGTLSRSSFGLARNVPFISDEVNVDISIEFLEGSTESSAEAARIAHSGSAKMAAK